MHVLVLILSFSRDMIKRTRENAEIECAWKVIGIRAKIWRGAERDSRRPTFVLPTVFCKIKPPNFNYIIYTLLDP